MAMKATAKVVSLPPKYTYFCGMVRSVVANGKGVTISNGRAEYVVQSLNDAGLAHIQVGRRCLAVFCLGRIVAVYRRPRMPLIPLLCGDDVPSSAVLAKFNPVYQKA